MEGNIDLLNQNIIAIVGSRKCTTKGKQLARKFAEELSDQNVVIASGMAEGIDTVAHRATLDAQGKTIAILGNGFNHIFPERNIELYKEIIKRGGLIVSEYPPKVKVRSELFLERNRIVSGLSIGVLVIEATYRSGTSVTAKLAKKQGRKVFALPHEISDNHGVGTNKLIRKGAILVTSTKEIIEEFKFLEYRPIKIKQEIQEKMIKSKKNEKIEDKIAKIKNNDVKVKIEDKEQRKIYDLIKTGIVSADEISRKSRKTINEISNILFMLEIEGHIQKIAGGYKCI